MSFRFLKISSYYRDFLNSYYVQYPNVAKLDYAAQYSHLMEQYFAWSDNYGRLLAQKGFETMEVIANAALMQKAWAKENGFPDNLSSEETVIKQIAVFKPEIIYFQDVITFNGAFINKIKSSFPCIKLCIGNICSPFSSEQIESFKVFDYFTVCSPFFQKQLRNFNIESVVIPHAFDWRILQKLDENNIYPETTFMFTGSIIPDEGFHSIRLNILEELVKEDLPFVFYGNLPDKSLIKLWKRQASFVASKFLDGIGLKKVTDTIPLIRKGRALTSLPRNMKISGKLYNMAYEPVFGLEMFKAMSKSKIGFNIHGDCAGDYAANMRLFETTGIGTCLLTDEKSDLHNYFEIDKEVIAYSSADECVEKVKWLINNPAKCSEIAINGQTKTLNEHHFESRVQMFYDFLIRKLLK